MSRPVHDQELRKQGRGLTGTPYSYLPLGSEPSASCTLVPTLVPPTQAINRLHCTSSAGMSTTQLKCLPGTWHMGSRTRPPRGGAGNGGALANRTAGASKAPGKGMRVTERREDSLRLLAWEEAYAPGSACL